MFAIPHPIVGETLAAGASRATGVEAAPLARPASETSPGKIVLIVDDDAALRTTAAMILQCQGFQTLEAGNGLEALHLIERNPQVGAVLLDLLMPVMDGEETFRQLRRFWSAVPVVVISGFNFTEIARNFVAPAPEAFVQKPFSFENLISTLGRVMA